MDKTPRLAPQASVESVNEPPPKPTILKSAKKLSIPTLLMPPTNNNNAANHGLAPHLSTFTRRLSGINPASLSPGLNPYAAMYPSKASEFMFKQFSGFKDFTMNTAKSGMSVGEKILFWVYNKMSQLSKRWFTHIFLFLVMLGYSIAGAMIFVAVEGAHEQKVIEDIHRSRFKFLQTLRQITRDHMDNSPEVYNQWESLATKHLAVHEGQLQHSYKVDGIVDKGQKDWTFWNAMFFCGTIYTTIGYGHITPVTTTGKTITILYAIIGIPIFLIVLTDFGKLLTRIIKYVWAFVRRLYYTGSCRRVRKTDTVQEVMKGVQMVYDIATFRRPSQMNLNETVEPVPKSSPVEPCTPAPSNFAIDDDFNLPITVALGILIVYILSGALVYTYWEAWSLFDSFYFVFISMSTIGFGDFVPGHPIYMMSSILYLVFGLALTSMCINVVQIKLSDTFRLASAKISATIGLHAGVVDEDAQLQAPSGKDIADVHV